MIYIIRVRQLVKIVHDETENTTDPMNTRQDLPSVNYCLYLFRQKHKRRTKQAALRTLAIATGEHKFISVVNHPDEQQLQVTAAGLILLTPTGFINALCGSVNKISSTVAVIISIAALVVSIIWH